MSSASLLALCLAIPLAGAALVAASGRRPNLREALSLLTGAALSTCALLLLVRVARGERPALEIVPLLPNAPIALCLEPLGAVFAALAACLWIVTTIYSIGYMRRHDEADQTRFYACFALALHATMGIALAGNLLTLFVFYELLTLSTFPLVTHAGNAASKRAGRIYLGVLLSTSIGLLLLALLRTNAIAGRLDFQEGGILAAAFATGRIGDTELSLLFLLFAFGVGKAALMPFHRWLPAAMVAPTPVSALLHAVAVVKAGVFTLLKVGVYVFGLDTLRAAGAGIPVAWVAAATMVLASAIACTREDLKERLAYSTIGQLAYIVAGVATATAAGALGAALHVVTHAFGKITLFFAAGAVIVTAHRTEIRTMTGLGRAMPYTFGAFAVASLSIIGLPPLGGTWSKWWLGTGLAEAHHPALLALWLLSSLLSAVYLLPVAIRAFGPASRAEVEAHMHGPAPLACRIAMTLSTAGCVALFFLIDPLVRLLQPVMDP
jgi:multicomponent Na+:H+ antiporter subunit D